MNTEFKGEIIPSVGADVYFRKDLALPPAEVYIWKGVTGESDDEYGKVNILRKYSPEETITVSSGENLVVDIGQNCAAVPSFVFRPRKVLYWSVSRQNFLMTAMALKAVVWTDRKEVYTV